MLLLIDDACEFLAVVASDEGRTANTWGTLVNSGVKRCGHAFI